MVNPESSFTKVADTSEIHPGKMRMVKIKEDEILIVNVNSKYYAVSNSCPPQKRGPLQGHTGRKYHHLPSTWLKIRCDNWEEHPRTKADVFQGQHR
jgi:nitrite reductase/ring-hydroxylating ferredoxin subunit